ncbi:hypothetical protein [Dactylosporangium sp. CA-233914]|uniref:hypothetical protein n=1 Tax=Dactylosporangium sp. CA-233914 TaxID=3239934 RepID=UPI003D91697D
MAAGYLDLANTIMADVRRDYEQRANPHLKQLRIAMTDCLQRAGYRPADRDAFIASPEPKRLGVAFGAHEGVAESWAPAPGKATVQIGPAVPARRYVPTPAESDLALAWQRCTVESGLSTTLQPMVRDAQMAAVLKHEDQLAEYATRTAEAARRLAAIG